MSRRRVGLLSMPAALLCAAFLSCPPAAATPGDLDPTFGEAGRVLTHVDELRVRYPTSMAIQPDGRIVVVGGGEEVLAVRYRTDGALDRSFAGDGTVHLPFGRAQVSVTAVAIDEEGRIVVAGVAYDRPDRRDSWFVVRLDRAGRLDPSFGGNGVVTINLAHHVLELAPGYFGTDLSDMALDSDGRILLAGNAASHDHDSETDEDIDVYFSALVRMDSDGSLDDTFGTKGRVFRRFAAYGIVSAMTILPDGRILLGEGSRTSRLVQYSRSGSFEGGFGDVSREMDALVDLTVAPDRSVVGVGRSATRLASWVVARYREDGSLDEGFGSDGVKTTQFSEGRWWCAAEAVAVQPDGRIVVVGRLGTGELPRFGILRYRADGHLDRSFGGDGKVFTDLLGARAESSSASEVAIQPGGKIIAAGYTARPSRDSVRWAVVRYLA